MSRFVRPETARLTLSEGDWIEVRKRLSSGETRALYARLYEPGPDGRLKTNPLQSGIALVVAYLLDWSLRDEAGQPVAIRGLSYDDLMRVVDSLDVDSFGEIRAAIDAHETAMVEARAQEKKRPDGMTGAAVISFSPSAAAGGSSGSGS